MRLAQSFHVIFEERCKLYRFSDDTREWKERGTGSMKVLENTNTKKCRVVMRRDQVGSVSDTIVFKVCANHQLLPGMTIQVMPRQEKAMMWYCEDFSEDQKSHEKLSARFASVEVANKFKEVFEKAVKNAEGGESSPVKPTKKKKAEDKEKSSDSNESVPQKGYGDQFKLQPGQCVYFHRYCDISERGIGNGLGVLIKIRTRKKQRHNLKLSKRYSKSMIITNKVFGSGFGGNLSFASLAKSASGSIFDSAHTQKAQAEFAAQAKSKAHSKHKEGGEGDGEHGADEEYEPDVQFAPVVPLPDLVDVVTGEEGEEVCCVLSPFIRFSHEVREMLGDLILRNPKTNKYRVVMRREQVHKVCANFAIAPKTELNEKKGMPNVYNWVCRDYSESPDGVDEIFTAKFKTAEIAKEFHDKFMEAVAAVVSSIDFKH
ncbi:unnamed protein product [Haemonchus placei]|uniref:RanBD1 domain-containing protein n=1 Tax=Haemonchus placei TaxID=6290 RepID=A0A3P7VIC5_HAEPC|nr:unnamed protein product [Haemonchus placei]